MRRSGKTYRIVDNLVQHYFTTGSFEAEDHFHDGNPAGSDRNKVVFMMVARRLKNEHGIIIHPKDALCRKGIWIYPNPLIHDKHP